MGRPNIMLSDKHQVEELWETKAGGLMAVCRCPTRLWVFIISMAFPLDSALA
jgi:hypothetical protein